MIAQRTAIELAWGYGPKAGTVPAHFYCKAAKWPPGCGGLPHRNTEYPLDTIATKTGATSRRRPIDPGCLGRLALATDSPAAGAVFNRGPPGRRPAE